MDKTAWYGMMKKYYYQASENDPKVYVSGKVSFGKSVSDDYSLGNHIKDQDVPRLIQKYIDAKELPEDKNGVYFIIPSADVDGSVDQDKFGEAYCGYHDAGNLSNGNKVFYSVIHVRLRIL